MFFYRFKGLFVIFLSNETILIYSFSTIDHLYNHAIEKGNDAFRKRSNTHSGTKRNLVHDSSHQMGSWPYSR